MACTFTSADPYFSNVTLLNHANGANGSTAFLDNSPLAQPQSPVNATITTAVKKFGTGSADFTANANSRIAWGSTHPNPAFTFGSGQFTVEFQGYLNAFSAGAIYIGIGNFFLSNDLTWDFGIALGSLGFFYSTNGTTALSVSAVYTPTLSTWVAYAVDRDASNVLRVYADGVVIASATVASSFYNGDAAFQQGNDGNTTRNWNGYIDEIRVTKGIARYAGAYTPATQAFPDGFVSCSNFFHGPFGGIQFPSPMLVAALGSLALGKALRRNRTTTRRGLFRLGK